MGFGTQRKLPRQMQGVVLAADPGLKSRKGGAFSGALLILVIPPPASPSGLHVDLFIILFDSEGAWDTNWSSGSILYTGETEAREGKQQFQLSQQAAGEPNPTQEPGPALPLLAGGASLHSLAWCLTSPQFSARNTQREQSQPAGSAAFEKLKADLPGGSLLLKTPPSTQARKSHIC